MEVRSLKTLHSYANVFGLFPTWTKPCRGPQNGPTFWDRVKAAVFILVFALAIGYNLYGKIFDYAKYMEDTIVLVNTLSDILITVFNVFAIYKLNWKDGKKLLQFLQKLQSFETFIINKDEIVARNRKALIRFYVFHALGVIFGFFGAFVYIKTFGIQVYKYLILREFQNSHFMIVMDMVICYTVLISLRMSELNAHLRQHVQINKNFWVDITVGDEEETGYKFTKKMGVLKRTKKDVVSVQLISEAYTTMAELVAEANELFGMIVMIFCGNMIVNIMVPVNMALVYVRGMHIYTKSDVGVEFIGFCLFWITFPIVMGVNLLYVCGSVETQADSVPRLCYTLMKTLGSNEFKLRNDLDYYGSQATRVKIKFTAGGLFDVNLGLLMPILGSVFTYLIVLMQFHNF